MKKEWRPVRGKEDWAEISNYGLIHYYAGKSMKYPDERWTYGSDSGKGYLRATIGNVNKGVHQWVYMTFVGDIPKGMQVNHIDEDKHNNCVWNLNLMTPKENTNWGTGNARRSDAQRGKARPYVAAAQTNHPKMSKPVQALNPITMEVVMEFPSTREAQRHGFHAGHISDCCLGRYKTHKGLIWRWKSV